MSLPLTRSASKPLMRRAKGPSPVFTHSPPHALLHLLQKVPCQLSLVLTFFVVVVLVYFYVQFLMNSRSFTSDSKSAQLLTLFVQSWTCSHRFTCQLSWGFGCWALWSVCRQPLQSLFWSHTVKSIMRMWALWSEEQLFWIWESCARLSVLLNIEWSEPSDINSLDLDWRLQLKSVC